MDNGINRISGMFKEVEEAGFPNPQGRLKFIEEYLFKQTCSGCPEQYDVFNTKKENKKVAYLRLRHGYFQVIYPDYDGKIIYEAYPEGDGNFTSKEREYYLAEAVKRIREAEHYLGDQWSKEDIAILEKR